MLDLPGVKLTEVNTHLGEKHHLSYLTAQTDVCIPDEDEVYNIDDVKTSVRIQHVSIQYFSFLVIL